MNEKKRGPLAHIVKRPAISWKEAFLIRALAIAAAIGVCALVTFLLTMLVVTFVFRKLDIDIWSESLEEETKSNEQPENKRAGMDEGKIRNG